MKTTARIGVAMLVSGIVVFTLVWPLLIRVDLFPVPYLLSISPELSLVFPFLSTIVAVLDALLVWIWASWGLTRILGSLQKRYAREPAGPAPTTSGKGTYVSRFAMALLVVCTLPSAMLFGLSLKTDVPMAFGGTYRRVCSQCHAADRALSYLRSPEAWALTIAQHRRFAPDRISEDEASAALAYLQAKRSASGADLFRLKCLRCHGEAEIRTPRPRLDWEQIVDRMARFNTFQMTPMESREILAYLETSALVKPEASGSEDDQRRLFEKACIQCHTLDVALLPEIADDEWPVILSRMAAKAPAIIREEEARALAPFLVEMRRDPDLFRHRVPHQSSRLFFGGTGR